MNGNKNKFMVVQKMSVYDYVVSVMGFLTIAWLCWCHWNGLFDGDTNTNG